MWRIDGEEGGRSPVEASGSIRLDGSGESRVQTELLYLFRGRLST